MYNKSIPPIYDQKPWLGIKINGQFTKINYKTITTSIFELTNNFDCHNHNNNALLIAVLAMPLLRKRDAITTSDRRFTKLRQVKKQSQRYHEMCC